MIFTVLGALGLKVSITKSWRYDSGISLHSSHGTCLYYSVIEEKEALFLPAAISSPLVSSLQQFSGPVGCCFTQAIIFSSAEDEH